MTKRPQRQADGLYHIDGKKFKFLFGSRAQVFHETAYKTMGLLTKRDIVARKYRHGKLRYLSRKKHLSAKKHNRLLEHGYTARRGKFGAVRVAPATTQRRSARQRKNNRTRSG